jgi:hypothetical protein
MILPLVDDPPNVVLQVIPTPRPLAPITRLSVRPPVLGELVLPSGECVAVDPVVGVQFGGVPRWFLTGTTRNSAGVALGDCRVIVLEVGRIAVQGAPVVAETVSDGAGAYSVEVPLNTAYQVLAYKEGAPAVTGATLNTVTPTQV